MPDRPSGPDAREARSPEAHVREAFYVSTPQGIFMASGFWFAATEEALRSYAAPVLEHVSLRALLRRAERWLRSPQLLALWALPLLPVVLGPWAAGGLTLALYVLWSVAGPSLPSRHVARVWGWLDHVVLQGGYYVFVLSMLAAQGRYAAMAVGLAGFVLLRWGLVQWALGPLVRPLQRALYDLPVPDQVLRAFILRAALEHRVEVPQIERMRRRMQQRWGA